MMDKFMVSSITDNVRYPGVKWRVGELGDGSFIQAVFSTINTDNPERPYLVKGRKWYISPHAIEDEVVKTCWLALEIAHRHEMMEQFKYKGVAIFHPHADVEVLRDAQELPHVFRQPNN